MTNKLMLGTLVGLLSLTACGDKTDAAASGSASAKPAASGAASGAPKKEEPAAAKPLTLAQFTTDVPVAACKTVVSCKNEEVSVSAGTTMQMVAGFGGMDDPKITADLKAIGEAMEKDKRQVMNASECTTVMGAVTKVSGFSAEKIQPSIDAKKVEFNGEKAAACLAAVSAEPPFCKEEKKVKPDLKLADLEKIMKPYQKEFEDHLKACDGALVGKVAIGEACESGFECAGDEVDCKAKKCVSKTK